ncbi:ImmA/IrrE family metallo-endopeptidase [Ideonella sp.]|uniref:ImmA/IrrE family metallo-endopeptidase n=1 Tax=Ideonella sp. TaxID=1929293 RepID=UPI003BB7B4F9
MLTPPQTSQHPRRRTTLAWLASLPALSGPAWAATPPADAKEAMRAQGQAIVGQVLEQLRLANRAAKAVPQVIVRNEPFLIGIELKDLSKPELIVPLWAEAAPPLRGLISQLVQLAGSTVPPQTFFEDTFNWALVAHEMGHYFVYDQVPAAQRMNDYVQEAEANRFMVAFWNTQPRAREQLDRCGEVWQALATRMPSPVPAGTTPEAHFIKNYQALSEDPMAYGWYQFKWMADAWRERDTLTFAGELQRVLGRGNVG